MPCDVFSGLKKRRHEQRGCRHPSLIVDNHPLVRDDLRARLSQLGDIEVVGEAGQQVEPHLVLMDVGMNDVNGIDLTSHLLVRDARLLVLMLSMYDHRNTCIAPCERAHVVMCSTTRPLRHKLQLEGQAELVQYEVEHSPELALHASADQGKTLRIYVA